jgi:hypothetical protein
MFILMNKDLLQERREGVNQCKRLTTVAICRATTESFACVLLIEPQPYPGDQPPKLDDNERALKTNYAHDGRKCDICHWKCL